MSTVAPEREQTVEVRPGRYRGARRRITRVGSTLDYLIDGANHAYDRLVTHGLALAVVTLLVVMGLILNIFSAVFWFFNALTEVAWLFGTVGVALWLFACGLFVFFFPGPSPRHSKSR